MDIDRRSLFRAGVASAALAACHRKTDGDGEPAAPFTPPPAWPLAPPTTTGVPAIANIPHDELVDLPLFELGKRYTAVQLVDMYTQRIAALSQLNAVIEIDPDARTIAAQLDAEKTKRGPLHGMPILVKDNIDTAGKTRTTAGSLAFEAPAPRDAPLIAKLRAAGGIVLGKANLSEWANLRGLGSISGWSARGGITRNPYALDRNCSGSSSGSASATAASLCAAALGSETDGSITSPASICSLVGLKPTVGLVSRTGVIPISSSQDTVGPMGRCVADVAALLGAIAGSDPDDPATASAHVDDYLRHLDPKALAGARVGIPRKGWFGISRTIDSVMTGVIAKLAELGAVVVDNIALEINPQLGGMELLVFACEMKPAMEAYLARRGDPKLRSMLDLIAFDYLHPEELRWYGHEYFEAAQQHPGLRDAGYDKARAQCLAMSRDLIDAAMQKDHLDAIVVGTGGLAWLTDMIGGDALTPGPNSPQLPAIAGYPHVTVPAGFYHSLPIGMSFIGAPYTEGKLLGYAYAFEQATKARRPPQYFGSSPL
ncbi:MAG: amidase [Kofleriaceae bacterium]